MTLFQQSGPTLYLSNTWPKLESSSDKIFALMFRPVQNCQMAVDSNVGQDSECKADDQLLNLP